MAIRNRKRDASEAYWRLPITWVLAGAFGFLMIAVAGTMLFFVTATAERQTGRMMREIGDLIMDRSLEIVEEFFAQEEKVGLIVADIMSDPQIMSAPASLQNHLSDILSRQTAIDRLTYTYPDGLQVMVHLAEGEAFNSIEQTEPPQLPEGAGHESRFWHPPYFDEELQATYMRLVIYIQPEGQAGHSRITVDYPVRQLEDLLERMVWRTGQQPFVLFNNTMVLASTEPLFDEIPHTAEKPVPRIDDMTGTSLAHIWDYTENSFRLPVDFGAHVDVTERGPILFIYSPLKRHSQLPLQVGSYMSAADFGQPITILNRVAFLALGVLLIGLVAIVFIGRAIGRPIRALSRKALEIQDLDIEGAPRLPRSHLKELDETNASFNGAIGALEAFSRYVPKALVKVLLKRDFLGLKNTELRQLTIMFTDIAGFTTVASKLSAEETTQLLNKHFEEMSQCIVETGGTIDKYLGDGVMAFWGAPEEALDHVDRAVKTVELIHQKELLHATEHDEGQRLRIRIGVHTGTVVVGNIGSTERMDYTVIGDAVNVASRLQELGKKVDSNATVIALASEETVRQMSAQYPKNLVGAFELRGREQPVNVYRIL